MKMKSREASSGALLFVGSILFLVVGYVINVWLGRVLGPTDYGAYVVVISVMTTLNLIQTAGLPQAISRQIANQQNNVRTVLATGLYIQIALTAALTLFLLLTAPLLAQTLHDQSLSPYLMLAAFVLPLYGLYAFFSGYRNGLHDFNRQGLMSVSYSIMKLILVIWLTYRFGLGGAIIAFILAPVLPFLIGLKIVKGKFNKTEAMRIIIPTIPLTIYAIISTIHITATIFFVKVFLSAHETGVYAADQNIASVIFFATNALAQMILPIVSRQYAANNKVQLAESITLYYRLALIITAPLVFMAYFASKNILLLLYGNQYISGSVALGVLAVAMGIFSIASVLAAGLAGTQYLYSVVRVSFVGFAALCLGSIFLIPRYGLLGASLATLIGSGLVLVGYVTILMKRVNVVLPLWSTVKIITAAVVSSAISLGFKSAAIDQIILSIVGAIMYLGILWVMKEITMSDIAILWRKQVRAED